MEDGLLDRVSRSLACTRMAMVPVRVVQMKRHLPSWRCPICLGTDCRHGVRERIRGRIMRCTQYKTFHLIVRVSQNWIDDGFDMTEERCRQVEEELIPYAT